MAVRFFNLLLNFMARMELLAGLVSNNGKQASN